MSAMAPMVTTPAQAAPLYIYSFMVIILIAFQCLHVLQVVGIHHLTGGKVWHGLCALKNAYIHGAIYFQLPIIGESDISEDKVSRR